MNTAQLDTASDPPVLTDDTPARRASAIDIEKRFEMENNLFVKRTTAILTLNGLMAASIAAGDRLPLSLKMVAVSAMIGLNCAWLVRARSTSGFILRLRDTLHGDYYKGALPADVQLYKEWTGGRPVPWFNTTNVFSIVIPLGLLLFWLSGLLILPFSSAVPTTGRYQLVPAAVVSGGEMVVFDTQTGTFRQPDAAK